MVKIADHKFGIRENFSRRCSDVIKFMKLLNPPYLNSSYFSSILFEILHPQINIKTIVHATFTNADEIILIFIYVNVS